MCAKTERLIAILDNKRVFLPQDIPTLNQLLSEVAAEAIPEGYRGDVIDVIDMMYMCGNVDVNAGTRIDHLHNSLLNR